MAAGYGFDISKPAGSAQEAVQWVYFAYLAAVKEQDGAAMSMVGGGGASRVAAFCARLGGPALAAACCLRAAGVGHSPLCFVFPCAARPPLPPAGPPPPAQGRLDAFLDTYFERDLAAGRITESEAQEMVDQFVMKMRIVR